MSKAPGIRMPRISHSFVFVVAAATAVVIVVSRKVFFFELVLKLRTNCKENTNSVHGYLNSFPLMFTSYHLRRQN